MVPQTIPEAAVVDAPTRARALQVTDRETYDQAGAMWETLHGLEKQIKTYYEPRKKKAHEVWKGVVADEKSFLAPVSEAKEILRKKQSRWRVEEDEKAKRETEALKEQAEEQGIDPDLVAVAKEEIKSGPGQRKIWDVMVTDPQKIPREYLLPDLMRIISTNLTGSPYQV